MDHKIVKLNKMTPFERYVGMLEGKAVDFVPRTPILMQFAAEFIGSDYGAFASGYKPWSKQMKLVQSISELTS